MELEIQYFPQTDTLYIGNSAIANDGYDIAYIGLISCVEVCYE